MSVTDYDRATARMAVDEYTREHRYLGGGKMGREAGVEAVAILLASRREGEGGAAADVLAERQRQIETEGWTAEHDEGHAPDDLARAGACYALPSHLLAVIPEDWSCTILEWLWPWEEKWWKPKDRRRNLVRAAALLIAEIERLDRITPPEVKP